MIFLQKDAGVGQTEAVDGLLYVAHQKELVPAAGKGGEEPILTLIHVLILVHHHFPPTLRELGGYAVLFVLQKREHHVFLIGEVHGPLPPLFGAVSPVQIGGELQEGRHGGSGEAELREKLGRALGEVAFQLGAGLAALVPESLGMGLERVTMRKYNIDDLRLLFENDLRFLDQF